MDAMNSKMFLIVGGLMLILVLAGCSSTEAEPTWTPVPTWTPNAPPSSTTEPTPHEITDNKAVLTESSDSNIDLEVSSSASSMPKYNRNEWSHWTDMDGDCQNERHEVLIYESIVQVSFKDDTNCQVLSGEWVDPYTGQTIYESSNLDIDHMVPLKNAHDSGGWQWNATKKKEFANDRSYPNHLIAVTSSANRQKGAKGPEDWKPSNTDYWCTYAISWTDIKGKWNLTVTEAELFALQEMLNYCNTKHNITVTQSTNQSVNPTPTPKIEDTIQNLLFDPDGPDRNCGDFTKWSDAQTFYEAAGGPYRDPHRLDGDKDGIACTSLPGAP